MSEYIRVAIDKIRVFVAEYTQKLDTYGQKLAACIATIPTVRSDNDIDSILIGDVMREVAKMLRKCVSLRTSVAGYSKSADDYDAELERYAEQDRLSGGIDRSRKLRYAIDSVDESVSHDSHITMLVARNCDTLFSRFESFESGVAALVECVTRIRAFVAAADRVNTAIYDNVYDLVQELMVIGDKIRYLDGKIPIPSMCDVAARLLSLEETALDSANADSIVVEISTHNSTVLMSAKVSSFNMKHNRESLLVTIPKGSSPSDYVILHAFTYKPASDHIRWAITKAVDNTSVDLTALEAPITFNITKYNSARV